MKYPQEILFLLIKEVVEKSLLGEINTWTHYHFTELSEQITQASKISINHRTLKRLFGKENSDKISNPHPSTLDALSIYLGYSGWNEYRQKKTGDKTQKKQIKTKISATKYIYLTAILLIGIILILFIISKFGKIKRINEDKFVFTSNKNIAFSPADIKFTYDIPKKFLNRVVIRFESGFKKYYPSNCKGSIIHSYKTPDVSVADILVDDIVIKKNVLIIQSKGWYTRLQDENHTYPCQIDSVMFRNGIMKISDNDFMINSSKLNISRYWSKFIFVNMWDIDADNARYKFKIRTDNQNEGNSCPDVVIRMAGRKGNKIQLHFVQLGCNSYIRCWFGEKLVSGETEELQAFQTNVKEYHDYQVLTSNQNITVYLDSVEIYKTAYTPLLDSLTSIGILTAGCGYVDYVNVNNLILVE